MKDKVSTRSVEAIVRSLVLYELARMISEKEAPMWLLRYLRSRIRELTSLLTWEVLNRGIKPEEAGPDVREALEKIVLELRWLRIRYGRAALIRMRNREWD